MSDQQKRQKTKTGIMSAALIFTGVIEFLEHVEDGDNPLLAAGKAYDETKARGKAIKEAARKVNRRIREGKP